MTAVAQPAPVPKRPMAKKGWEVAFLKVVMAFGWDKRTNSAGQIVGARDKFILN